MMTTRVNGRCSCGAVSYEFEGLPLARAYCHCKICQAYNNGPFGDVLAVRSKDVQVKGQDDLILKSHTFPPLVKRGRCRRCGGTAIEQVSLPLLPDMTIIPGQTIEKSSNLPKPELHIFYHRRVSDMTDALPKYSGYLPSQIALTATLLSALHQKRS